MSDMSDLDNAVVAAMLKAREIGVQMLASDCEAILQAAKQSMQGEATKYIEVRQCHACHHVGVDDMAVGISACGRCDWNGDEPKEDICPGCGIDNHMMAACPECHEVYHLVEGIYISSHAPDSAARIAEQDSEIASFTKELEEALKALQGAKAYFDSDGDISSNSERSIVAAIDTAIRQIDALNIKGGAE